MQNIILCMHNVIISIQDYFYLFAYHVVSKCHVFSCAHNDYNIGKFWMFSFVLWADISLLNFLFHVHRSQERFSDRQTCLTDSDVCLSLNLSWLLWPWMKRARSHTSVLCPACASKNGKNRVCFSVTSRNMLKPQICLQHRFCELKQTNLPSLKRNIHSASLAASSAKQFVIRDPHRQKQNKNNQNPSLATHTEETSWRNSESNHRWLT